MECASRGHVVTLVHGADADKAAVKAAVDACSQKSGKKAYSFLSTGRGEGQIEAIFAFLSKTVKKPVDMLLLTVDETFEGEIGEIHATEGSIRPLMTRMMTRNYLALAGLVHKLLPALVANKSRVGLVIPPHAFDGSGLGMTAQYALEGYFKSLAEMEVEAGGPKASFSMVYNGKNQTARVILSSGEVDEDAMAGTGPESEQDRELASFVIDNVLKREESAIFGDASIIQRSGSLAAISREKKRDSMRASFQLPPACRASAPEPFDRDSAPALSQLIMDGDKVRIKDYLKKMKGSAGLEEEDSNGRTPLHYACESGNAEAVMLLLRSKPVPDAKKRDAFQWTPMHYAARAGCGKVVRPLLKIGADPNSLTGANESAIHLFCAHLYEAKSREQQQLESALKDLINQGADVNQRDEDHCTPMFVAVANGSLPTLQFLLGHEGDVHRRNRQGEISLHVAVRDNKLEIAKMLLKYGADPGAVGEEGSCFELAPTTEMMDLIEEFREVNRKDESEDLEKQREPIYINSLDDFPDNVKKIIGISGLDKEPELVKEHWVLFLWVLRFLMRKHYCPSEDLAVDLPKRHVGSKCELGDIGVEAAEEQLMDHGNPRKLFKLLEECGRGGFGCVFLAKMLDKSRVAVKRMSHVTDKHKWINLDEVYFLKNSIDCPNIVDYNAAYLMRDEIWISMEYLEGGTLQNAVGRTKFTEAQIAYITKSILKGLKHIHNKGWVHRDLKSANIMLTINGDIKIIDFGLCVDLNVVGEQKTMVGSPFWIPPEMIRHQVHSYPADIWSLGILVLEMTNLEAPNRHSALRAMFLTGAGVVPTFKDATKWSEEFHDFMGQMLKTEPDERPSAAELLKHPWIKTADTRKSMRNTLHQLFLEKSLEDSLGIGGL